MTRHSLPRPTLLPGMRPLWRDPKTVQLGTDPAQAIVLELPHPAAARLLELLDGAHTERAIINEMARIGMREADTLAALGALIESGLVVAAHTLMPAAVPAHTRERITGEAAAIALRFRDRRASPAAILRRRYAARVIVAGTGPIAELLMSTLLAAGVGTVGRADRPGETAKPVASRTRERVVRAEDAFVVQIGGFAGAGLPGVRRQPPHLVVGVRDAVAIVGPLVEPEAGPCVRCIDLHRTDRDPAWPRLAAQLSTEPGPCAAATLLTATGFASAEVLAYIDGGRPTTIGTTVEINGVAPWRRRIWTPHPRCDCGARPAPPTTQPAPLPTPDLIATQPAAAPHPSTTAVYQAPAPPAATPPTAARPTQPAAAPPQTAARATKAPAAPPPTSAPPRERPSQPSR